MTIRSLIRELVKYNLDNEIITAIQAVDGETIYGGEPVLVDYENGTMSLYSHEEK